MNSLTMVYAYRESLISSEKEPAINTKAFNRLVQLQENYAEWKMSVLKSYILNDSIYVTFLKWQNGRDGEQVSGCQGRGCMGHGEGGAKTKRQLKGILLWWNRSVSWWWWHESVGGVRSHRATPHGHAHEWMQVRKDGEDWVRPVASLTGGYVVTLLGLIL